MIRKSLDTLYTGSGVLSVMFLMLIALMTLAQVAARPFGLVVPSANDFAGFCMAGSVFLGLTYTLRIGGHIRVRTLISWAGPRSRRGLELLCAASAACLIGYLVWYTGDMIITSHRMGEYTIGLVPVPKWIPMLLMFVGLLVFLIALLDDFVLLLHGGTPSYILCEETAEKQLPPDL